MPLSPALHIRLCKRQRLPKHIVQLIKAKRKHWETAKISNDLTAYKNARSAARVAILSHRRNLKNRLVCRKDRKALFSYLENDINSHEHAFSLCINGDVVRDSRAANLLLQEFSKNFSSASDISSCVNTYISKKSVFQSYCSNRATNS